MKRFIHDSRFSPKNFDKVLKMAVFVSFATVMMADVADFPLPIQAEAVCDIFAAGGTPCVAAHSLTRALFAAYDGPLSVTTTTSLYLVSGNFSLFSGTGWAAVCVWGGREKVEKQLLSLLGAHHAPPRY